MAKPVGAAQKVKLAPITEMDVTEYARLNSEYNRSKKERDKLRDALIPSLEAGYECPTTTPYLLEVTYQSRCVVDWKEICAAVVDLMGERLKVKAAALIAELQAEKKDVPQLNVKPNPDWEAE